MPLSHRLESRAVFEAWIKSEALRAAHRSRCIWITRSEGFGLRQRVKKGGPGLELPVLWSAGILGLREGFHYFGHFSWREICCRQSH
jgi:hypothetical protein